MYCNTHCVILYIPGKCSKFAKYVCSTQRVYVVSTFNYCIYYVQPNVDHFLQLFTKTLYFREEQIFFFFFLFYIFAYFRITRKRNHCKISRNARNSRSGPVVKMTWLGFQHCGSVSYHGILVYLRRELAHLTYVRKSYLSTNSLK